MRMTADEFDRERRYQTVMYFIRQMLDQGLITDEEDSQIDTKNRAKFLPPTGALLSGKSLLFPENRANIASGKTNYEKSTPSKGLRGGTRWI